MYRSVLLCLTLAVVPLQAQPAQAPPPIQSPEVHSDNTVTFRFRDPNAKEVFLYREGAQRIAMQKDDQGVWSVTTDHPLEPDLYGYSFVADGVALLDPSNSLMKPNLLNVQSEVHVPGPSSLPWEINDVPHGQIAHHFYRSTVVGDQRDYYVYTPPGYDPSAKKLYPVLYLLHGYSDGAEGWTAVGRANVILDNLIAQGKAKPMLIVMTLGYGEPQIVARTGPRLSDRGLLQRNYEKYRDALFTEVIPPVEKTYRVSKDRNSRAIAGLSMGGAESLLRRPQRHRPFCLDRFLQRGRRIGRLPCHLSFARFQSQHSTPSPLGRLRHRRPSDRAQSQIPGLAQVQGHCLHPDRNTRRPHLDGLAPQPLRIRPPLVPAQGNIEDGDDADEKSGPLFYSSPSTWSP